MSVKIRVEKQEYETYGLYGNRRRVVEYVATVEDDCGAEIFCSRPALSAAEARAEAEEYVDLLRSRGEL